MRCGMICSALIISRSSLDWNLPIPVPHKTIPTPTGAPLPDRALAIELPNRGFVGDDTSEICLMGIALALVLVAWIT